MHHFGFLPRFVMPLIIVYFVVLRHIVDLKKKLSKSTLSKFIRSKYVNSSFPILLASNSTTNIYSEIRNETLTNIDNVNAYNDDDEENVVDMNGMVEGTYNESNFGTDVGQRISLQGTQAATQFGLDVWQLKFCGRFLTLNRFPKNNIGVFDSFATGQPMLFNISISCSDLFQNSGLGTGNFIMFFYLLRQAAQRIGNIDVSITCDDAMQYRDSLILPWIMGHFSRSKWDHLQFPAVNRTKPSILEACTGYAVGYSIREMQYDLRRMAIAIAGIPYLGHASEGWAKKHLWSADTKSSFRMQVPNPDPDATPLVPNLEIDDAVIHFRCGDVVEYDDARIFGFMKFSTLTKHLSPSLRSVGIITQPFSLDGQQRNLDNDSRKMAKCQKLVYAFRDYIRERYPDENTVRITIRNDPKDTIATTFARIILANESVIGATTFGLFAGITSFGTSYILNRKPNEAILMNPDITNTTKNVKLIPSSEKYMFAKVCRDHWGVDGQKVLDWLSKDEDTELDQLDIMKN